MDLPARISSPTTVFVKALPPAVFDRLALHRSTDFRVQIESDYFVVRPIDQAHVHGLSAAIFKALNRMRLEGRVEKFGYGSQVNYSLKGKIGIGEVLFVTIFCWSVASFAFGIFGPRGDLFHAFAALLIAILPVIHVQERKSQEKRILQFVRDNLPEVLDQPPALPPSKF